MNQRLPGVESRFRLALRAVNPAPQGSRERVRTRLAATLAALYEPRPNASRDAADRAPRAAAKAKAGAGAGSSVVGAGKLAALALLGGMAGATLLSSFGSPKPAQIVYVDHSASQASPTPPPATAEPADPAHGPPRSAVATAASNAPPGAAPAAAAARSRRPRADREPGPSNFAAERALLDQARAALMQEEPQHALELLERHRSRFAGGILAEERDAMCVEALVGEHRFERARASAKTFRAQHPHSLFLPAVDSSIESIP